LTVMRMNITLLRLRHSPENAKNTPSICGPVAK
jgi:hypothetical protein